MKRPIEVGKKIESISAARFTTSDDRRTEACDGGPMTEEDETFVVRLHDGDERCETLCQAILALIHERGDGLPFPLIIGTLRIVEQRLFTDQPGV